MSKKVVEVKTLKVGKYVIIDGEASKITSIQTSSPGKHGAAKARVEALGIFDKQKRNFVKPVDSKCDVPMIDKRLGQVLALWEKMMFSSWILKPMKHLKFQYQMNSKASLMKVLKWITSWPWVKRS